MLSSFDYGRSVLLSYPELFTGGLFSHTGPTSEQLSETSFIMNFISNGYSNVDKTDEHKIVIKTSVSGPEPGYVATPMIFIVLALELLRSYGKLNAKKTLNRSGLIMKLRRKIGSKDRKAWLIKVKRHRDWAESYPKDSCKKEKDRLKSYQNLLCLQDKLKLLLWSSALHRTRKRKNSHKA